MSTIPARGKLKQEDCESQTSLGYRARLCLKKIKEGRKERRKRGKEGGRERRKDGEEGRRKRETIRGRRNHQSNHSETQGAWTENQLFPLLLCPFPEFVIQTQHVLKFELF